MSVIAENTARELSFGDVLYPLGKGKVEEIVSKIYNDKTSVYEYMQEQESLLSSYNPYAFEYLNKLAENIGRPRSSFFKFGVSILYQSLQEKVGHRQIPRISEDFVGKYQNIRKQHLEKAYGVPEGSSKKADDENNLRVSLFLSLEPHYLPEFSDNLLRPGEDVFSSPIVSGFITSYFFFREAFSDTSNYSNQPFH